VDALRLSLPSRRPPLGCLLSIVLAVFGWTGAWTIVSGVHDAAWSVSSLFGIIVSLPLAIFLGAYAAAALVQDLLHFLVPSRLEGDATVLRLSMWRTWEGLLSGFRRIDARMLREHLVGVSVGLDQGQNAQLFLVHRSGYHFYAGYTGDRRHLDPIAAATQAWIDASPASL